MIELLILLLVFSPVFGVSAWVKSKRSPMRRFEKALDESVAEGFLTFEQKNRILNKLSSQSTRVPFRAVTLILIFSALFVIAGLSLLIAHNWEHIGPTVRIAAYLILFYALGEAALRSNALPLIIAWFFFPILGIGLYAQTFQLSGDFILPYLTWALISLPLVWIVKAEPLIYIHVLLLATILFSGGFNKNNLLSILDNSDSYPILPWLYQVFILTLIFVESFWLKLMSFRFHALTLTAAWIFTILAAQTFFKLHEPMWFFIAASAISLFWLMITFVGKFSLRERALPYLGLFFSMYAMTFLWDASRPIHQTSSFPGIMFTLVMSGAALTYFILKNPHALSRDPIWNRLFQCMVLTPVLLSLCIPLSDEWGLKIIAVLANIFLILGALLSMWHGFLHSEEMSINLGSAILLLTLITRFIDIMGDMVQSGLGLIVSGLFLSGVAYGLSQARKHLIARSKSELPS